ncbi:MAG: DinB family protein [Gemmatimonadota bacterium]
MKRTLGAAALTWMLGTSAVSAQSEATFRDQIMGHFQQSSAKFTMLAEAMPASAYAWSPGAGVMEVGQVYMHVARYNFMYLQDNLGIPAPADVDLATMETIRDKAEVQKLLIRSIEHVKRATLDMSATELGETTTLYGQTVPAWAVLMQLVAHMNEHLGQSIAYARMNGVVPPWSG